MELDAVSCHPGELEFNIPRRKRTGSLAVPGVQRAVWTVKSAIRNIRC